MTNIAAGSGAAPMIVVAAALVDAAGHVLVQRRPAGKAHAGLWEFPGGKVEPGESLRRALVRELREELSVEADPAALVPVGFSQGDAGGRELVLLLFLTRRWTGEPVALDAEALAWHGPADLVSLPMPEADRPLVAALSRCLSHS